MDSKEAFYSFNAVEERHSEFAMYLSFINGKAINDRYETNPADPGVEAKLSVDQYQKALKWLKDNDPDQEFFVYSAGSVIYNAMDNKTVIQEFRDNIRRELDQCDGLETPHVCANISSPEGYAKMEKLIIDKVMLQKITIGEAIVQAEVELSPGADNV